MGIDIYLEWEDKDSDNSAEMPGGGFSTMAGHTGYLREAYHGGPYATKLLVREAFEAENCRAQIPAAVLRQRLTTPTAAAKDCDGGHVLAQLLIQALGKATAGTEDSVSPQTIQSGETKNMTVEEAVITRYCRLYPDVDAEHINDAVQSYRDFVELAERKEKETGKPCTIYASY